MIKKRRRSRRRLMRDSKFICDEMAVNFVVFWYVALAQSTHNQAKNDNSMSDTCAFCPTEKNINERERPKRIICLNWVKHVMNNDFLT